MQQIRIIWPNKEISYSHSVYIRVSARIYPWARYQTMIDTSIFDLKVSRRPSCQWLITHSLVLETEAESTEMSRIEALKWSVTWRSNRRPCPCRISRYQDPNSKRVSLTCTRTANLYENHQLKIASNRIPLNRSNCKQSISLTTRSCDKSSASAWKISSRQTNKTYN